ncbi:hypothetical protein AB0L65_16395 [Nonomuraea sp. NPDC052116]
MIAAVELLIADTQSAWLDKEEFTDVFVYEHEDKDKAVRVGRQRLFRRQ